MMTVDKCKRVMWRLQEKNTELNVITYPELRNAIMHECGTDSRTILTYVNTLRKLGWIKRADLSQFVVTDKGRTI